MKCLRTATIFNLNNFLQMKSASVRLIAALVLFLAVGAAASAVPRATPKAMPWGNTPLATESAARSVSPGRLRAMPTTLPAPGMSAVDSSTPKSSALVELTSAMSTSTITCWFEAMAMEDDTACGA